MNVARILRNAQTTPTDRSLTDPSPDTPEVPMSRNDPAISFAKSSDRSDLSDYSRQILSDNLRQYGLPGAKVTSIARTSQGQAEAMFDNLEKGTSPNYPSPQGKSVVDVYKADSDALRSRPDTISDMTAAIDAAGPARIRVSKHLGNQSFINVVDLSKKGIPNPGKFIDQLRNDPRVYRVLGPAEGDPAIHIEILQPGAAGIPASDPDDD